MKRLPVTMVLAAAVAAAAAQQGLDEHMVEHFVRAVNAQTALIHADLDGAREAARWLASHDVAEQLPPQVVADLATMQTEAARIASATSLDVAAAAAGRMAVACGSCHESMAVRTGLDSPIEFNPGEGLADRMARHLWAADRMWEGLIAPSDASWQAGAEALMEAPLTGQQVTGGPDEQIDRIGEDIRALAERARRASDPALRASLYGHFLSRCGACHARYRPGP